MQTKWVNKSSSSTIFVLDPRNQFIRFLVLTEQRDADPSVDTVPRNAALERQRLRSLDFRTCIPLDNRETIESRGCPPLKGASALVNMTKSDPAEFK